MGLQVRLRHALGERVLELPARSVEQPLVVGRGADADVQIPSISVGQHHLVLFVHEDHWIVQDAPGGTGTLVNGVQLAGPRVLRGGEVLALGPEANAPTIEIDPASIAVTPDWQHAHMGGSGGPTHPVHPAPAYQSAPPPAPSRMIPMGVATPETSESEAHEANSNGDETAWMAVPTVRRNYSAPRRRKSSDTAIAFSILAIIVILVGTAWFVYMHKRRPAQVVIVSPSKPVLVPATLPARPPPATSATFEASPTIAPPKLPDITDEQPAIAANRNSVDPRVDQSTSRVSKSTPAPSKGPTVPDTGPFEKSTTVSEDAEKAFKRVESAYYNPDPAKALLAFDAYVEEFPDAYKEKIEQYREDMLDKIWWERIDSLFEKRKALQAGIKKTEQDIKKEGPDGEAYKKTVLEPRLEDQKSRVQLIGDRLTKEMAYRIATPPPIGHDAEMRELREKRDRAVYEAWKKRVLKYIRSKHGAYPWANER